MDIQLQSTDLGVPISIEGLSILSIHLNHNTTVQNQSKSKSGRYVSFGLPFYDQKSTPEHHTLGTYGPIRAHVLPID